MQYIDRRAQGFDYTSSNYYEYSSSNNGRGGYDFT